MENTKTKAKRALVVEDEATISQICEKILNRLGFETDIAGNGRIAREMVTTKSYDLILADIRTPEMDGMELCHYLQQEHPELADRVIFTTGDVLNSDIKLFLSELKTPFLNKPFTPRQLEEAVNDVLSISPTGEVR
jgi:two-component system NtrC family sensor kinase